jgi:hypothetical protein
LGASSLLGFTFLGGGVALLIGGTACCRTIGGFGFALFGGGIALGIAWTTRDGTILTGLTKPKLLIARATGFAILIRFADLRIAKVIAALKIGFASRSTRRTRTPTQRTSVVHTVLFAWTIFVALTG